MSCRYWLPDLAVRGCLIALAFLFLTTEAVCQNPEAQAPAAQGQTEQPSANETRAPPASEDSGLVSEQKKPASGPYQADCEKPKDREDADLCAQRRMADAAEWQVI